jgi:carboxyl-terminal processing protease
MSRRAAALLLAIPILLLNICISPCAASEPAEKAASAAQSAAPAAQAVAPAKDDYYEMYKVLIDTMDQVDRNYVKEIDRRELVEAAIKGVLSKLDPYSSYIGPKELSSFRAAVESEFGGIGIQISTDDGDLRILSPLYGTPAYRAGLLAGDWIVEIDGKNSENLSQDEAIELLQGKEGSHVTLTVVHAGRPVTERLKVALTRERIHVDTVLADRRKADDTWDFMLDAKRGIGYVRVAAFSRETANDLQKALQQLKTQNMRGLILDLRFNPGGLLSSAIEVSNLFISSGRIVSTKGRNTPERVWDAHKNGAFEGFPMVILVNRYSASASEIVSACLQDHGRAVLMGERTWGKGSVQNVIELEDGRSALKLTTAAYHRPSGKNIHRFPDSKETDQWGVMPDAGFDLRLSDTELASLLYDRQRRDILRPNPAVQGHAAKPDGTQLKSGAAAPRSEPAEAGSQTLAPSKPATEAPSAPPEAPKPKSASEKPASPPAKTVTDPPRRILAPPKSTAPVVDRQLQMAVKYLTDELARAK